MKEQTLKSTSDDSLGVPDPLSLATSDADERFLSVLRKEDDLGVVVRGMTYVEATLRALIELHLITPSQVKWSAVGFERRLEFASALNALPPYFKGPLKTLAAIRNRFAHRVDALLDPTQTRRLYQSLGVRERNLVDDMSADGFPAMDEAQIALRNIVFILTLRLRIELHNQKERISET